ncbi:hypothetical protein XU18_2481 [Perkinsela sp. CCAP 1560/4]|nr:hypothetical protein XU18_2622 [Perkinsela sp. CCAP 1560/4]KNH06721.1 hypothetical protein XU18_2481 [Perkinsela sp. CCAP 1560/4]|eukprot:KNH06523.1 hypothetical protein XU18_2622 [Perkinsela sp. CCAP 1560/4]
MQQESYVEENIPPMSGSGEVDAFLSNYKKNTASGPKWIRNALARRKVDDFHLKTTCSTMPTMEDSLARSMNVLRYKRLQELNAGNQSKVGIFQHRYASNGKLFFSVGPDFGVQIYALSKNTGRKVGEVPVDFPAYSAQFLNDDTKIICGGKTRVYAIVDIETLSSKTITRGSIPCGDFSVLDAKPSTPVAAIGSTTAGSISFLDTRTQRCLSTLRVNHPVSSIAFDRSSSTDSPYFWACAGGEISLWDIRCLRCDSSGHNTLVRKHADHGGLSITAFAVCDSFYAAGSDVGVVNVYDAHQMRGSAVAPGESLAEARKPKHTILNLRTSITTIACSPDQRRIIYASDEQQNSVRMFDMTSQQTYKNFPGTIAKSIGRTLSAQFSPDGKLASLGSSHGKIYAYQLSP